jgi:hypothetical protein
MPVKVLQPVKPELVGSPAIFRDADYLILRQGIVLIPVRQVLAGFEDTIGQNRPSSGINALDNCHLLPVA